MTKTRNGETSVTRAMRKIRTEIRKVIGAVRLDRFVNVEANESARTITVNFLEGLEQRFQTLISNVLRSFTRRRKHAYCPVNRVVTITD